MLRGGCKEGARTDLRERICPTSVAVSRSVKYCTWPYLAMMIVFTCSPRSCFFCACKLRAVGMAEHGVGEGERDELYILLRRGGSESPRKSYGLIRSWRTISDVHHRTKSALASISSGDCTTQLSLSIGAGRAPDMSSLRSYWPLSLFQHMSVSGNPRSLGAAGFCV